MSGFLPPRQHRGRGAPPLLALLGNLASSLKEAICARRQALPLGGREGTGRRHRSGKTICWRGRHHTGDQRRRTCAQIWTHLLSVCFQTFLALLSQLSYGSDSDDAANDSRRLFDPQNKRRVNRIPPYRPFHQIAPDPIEFCSKNLLPITKSVAGSSAKLPAIQHQQENVCKLAERSHSTWRGLLGQHLFK